MLALFYHAVLKKSSQITHAQNEHRATVLSTTTINLTTFRKKHSHEHLRELLACMVDLL